MNEPSGSSRPASATMQALAILALCLATFSRLLEASLGLPRLINWLHFPLVGGLFAVSLRGVERDALPLFATVAILFLVFALSGWVNGAGPINVFLGFVLLAEPFLLLAVLVNGVPSRPAARALGGTLLALGIVQIPVVVLQLPHAIAVRKSDLVQGTFRGMGAGHHVMGAIAAIAALGILDGSAIRRRWLRWVTAALLFGLVVASDSKQVILAFVIAWVIQRAPSARSAASAAALAARLLVVVALVYAALWTVGKDEFFHRGTLVATRVAAKLEVFPLLVSHFDSPAQWMLGLGPGHGVSRLGGWLLEEYWNALGPLGATKTGVAEEAWQLSNPEGPQSSFFALLFSWAGIFGDIGVIGLAVYATLLWITYRRYCRDDLSRLLVLAIAVFGFVFEWLEEYNFMLYALAVIGQRWQEDSSRR